MAAKPRLRRRPLCVHIRVVRSEADMLAVARLRYEIYIKEMGKSQRYADHDAREIREPLDAMGVILAGFEGDRCVATVRLNVLRDGVGDYERYYRLNEFPLQVIERASVTTKLLVAEDRRHSLIGLRMSKALFAHAYSLGIRYDFIDCNPNAKTRPFFDKLGYRQLFGNFWHAEFGEATPLVLVLSDVSHFEVVKSPFASIVRELGSDPESVDVFECWMRCRHSEWVSAEVSESAAGRLTHLESRSAPQAPRSTVDSSTLTPTLGEAQS